MPTTLTIDEHLALIAGAGQLLASLAEQVDHDVTVPTCPEWTVRELVAHQGEVHRWATDTVTGQWDELSPADQADRVTAPLDPALISWFRTGVDDLVAALAAAPDTLQARAFLHDPPAPRHFWARRQAHETTIHRVDVQSAVLGRAPTAAEADIAVSAALDGIDELVAGFVPRRKTRLRSAEPFTLAIEPSDADRRWVLAVSADPVRTTESAADCDATFRGSAAELYLGLWNRGDAILASGRAGALAQWRDQVRVSWL